MFEKQKRLGDVLLAKGLVNPEQLNGALEEQARTKEILGQVLLKRNLISEKDLLDALSVQFGIPFVSLKYKYIDWNLLKKFSPDLILDYKCVPIQEDNDSVTFAINNPLDVWVAKKAEQESGSRKVKFALVSHQDTDDVIRRYREYIRQKYNKI